MKKLYKIKGMHCNSCAQIIENKLKPKVDHITVNYAKENAEIEFNENKIKEKEIIEIINKLGYAIEKPHKEYNKYLLTTGILLGIILVILFYKFSGLNLTIPEFGENASLILLFLAGLLTGFHCVSMCGGFVISYTAKNALNGYKGFYQHLVYGGSKVISYTIIGGIFGLMGGIFAFSTKLRGIVAILAGIFMIFYALSMFGFSFFKRFQFNTKFLTKASLNISSKTQGQYLTPFITGLLNGLFIACGPLQAMYLYAAGTGNVFTGAISLMVFGLGTLPIMFLFGSLATVISHKTTGRILKISAIIVLVLGLIMLNRGLSLTGNGFDFNSDPINNVTINNNIQEVNMEVSSSGYSPNSFVLKKGIPVKWNIDVTKLTGCNQEIVLNKYNINEQLSEGLNVIEFTPTETGTFAFTCGMGMLKGSFVVTETGTI